jgi:hypothetical protein
VLIQRRKAGQNRGQSGPFGVASREHSKQNQCGSRTYRLLLPPPPNSAPDRVSPMHGPDGRERVGCNPIPRVWSRRIAGRSGGSHDRLGTFGSPAQGTPLDAVL